MDSESSQVIELDAPPETKVEEEAVCLAYVNSTGEILHEQPVIDGKYSTVQAETDYNSITKSLTEKSLEGSRQSKSELGCGVITKGFSKTDVIAPPYPPKCLANFLEVDSTFSRAVKAKVLDSIGRDMKIQSTLPISPDNPELDESCEMPQGSISKEEFRSDKDKIQVFIDNCNKLSSFEDVLEKAAMDYESVGWAGLEVIRSRDGIVRRIQHVPATRLRVLRGFEGFAEVISDNQHKPTSGNYRFYQVFGDKYRIRDTELDQIVDYNPNKHGPLDDIRLGYELVENFRDLNGQPTDNVDESTNEILFLPKNHSNTIYYGYSDILPAIGAMVGNVYIRDYMLQFFEHNTIPRYAVIVKGAKIDDDFRKLITAYFSEHVKGQAHKTLILTLQGTGQKQIDIEFKKLDSDQKEADFINTRKELSLIHI